MAADMHSSVFFVFPVVVILPQVIVVDRALVAHVFDSAAGVNGQIVTGHDLAVVVGYIVVGIDGYIAAGNDVGVGGLFFDNAGVDGTGKFAHGVVIIAALQMRDLIGDIFIGHVPVGDEVFFFIDQVSSVYGNIALAFDIRGTVEQCLSGCKRQVAGGADDGAIIVAAAVLVINVLGRDAAGTAQRQQAVVVGEIACAVCSEAAADKDAAQGAVGKAAGSKVGLLACTKIGTVGIGEAACLH